MDHIARSDAHRFRNLVAEAPKAAAYHMSNRMPAVMAIVESGLIPEIQRPAEESEATVALVPD